MIKHKLRKRKNPPTERQRWMAKKTDELIKRAKPPMGTRMARFYARELWDLLRPTQ